MRHSVNTPDLVPFKAEHALAIVYRDGDSLESIEGALVKERGGPGFTAVYDSRVLGFAGINLLWTGVANAWTVVTPELATQFPIWMTRHVRRCIRDWFNVFNLHRLEAVVLADNVVNQKWIEMLGFVKEGAVAHEYTSDKRDVFRYEFIRPKDAIRVRHLRVEDEQQLLELLKVCDALHATYTPEWLFKTASVLVACDNGTLAGYVISEYEYESTLNELVCLGRGLGVNPAYRGFGLANRLHVARLVEVKKSGVQYFIGGVHSGAPQMKALFERYGAMETVTTKQHGTLYVQKVN